MTRYTDGFSYFVTSMTAPVASGWSDGRVGLAPTEKRRLTTAHTQGGHFAALVSTQHLAVIEEAKAGQGQKGSYR